MKVKAVFFFQLIASISSLIDCDNVLKDGKEKIFTGFCNNKWSNLKPLVKPTQAEIGYAWVQKKYDDDYHSKSKAQEAMDQNPIPAVIGPDNYFYVVDHHHELSALDYSEYSDVTVTLNVSCDQRNVQSMEDFWTMMKGSQLVYLGVHPHGNSSTLPIQIIPEELPQEFHFTKDKKIFQDDPWRALASFVRKVNSYYLNSSDCLNGESHTKLCYRGYYRGCIDGSEPNGPGVAFYEFRWGYYFLDGSYYQQEYWTNPNHLAAFLNAFSKQQKGEMGSYDLDQWASVASLVIPLARSEDISSYRLPVTLFHDDDNTTSRSGTLPGYVVGDRPILNDDPTCSSPSCLR
jgi:hypothetical protein